MKFLGANFSYWIVLQHIIFIFYVALKLLGCLNTKQYVVDKFAELAEYGHFNGFPTILQYNVHTFITLLLWNLLVVDSRFLSISQEKHTILRKEREIHFPLAHLNHVLINWKQSSWGLARVALYLTSL